MNVLSAFVTELRERRLWPVAAVLLAGIVAVPLVLAKSPAQAPTAPLPTPGLPAASNSLRPDISLSAGPSVTPPNVRGHDPFQAPAGSGTASSASGAQAAAASASPASSGATTGGTGTGASGGAGASGSGGTSGSTPAGPPSSSHASSPPGLTSTQSYRVALAINNSAGGLDQVDPLERLSVLPSRQQPLLIELGVLQGGGRVLFAVQPGAVVSGPGSCTPGPIDCQIVSVAPGQAETLSSSNGAVSNLLFAVTAITADQYPSTAAADKARQTASGEGRALLSHSTLTALSLFAYDPSLGAIVDLRNLSVGG